MSDYLSHTLAQRWALEPNYPPVDNEDRQKMRRLQEALAKSGPLVHDLRGVLVGVDLGLPAYISYLVVNDAYEHGDIDLVRLYVGADNKALVLGAGMGVVATALAQQTGKSVVCIDANAQLAERIAVTAALNNVELPFTAGAVVPGRKSGVVRFTLSDEFWASSLREDAYLAKEQVPVPVLDLAEMCAREGVDTLFVDIEGAEVGLFTPETIPPAVRHVFVEVHRPNLGPKAHCSVVNDLFALGFRMEDAAGLSSYWVR